MLYLSSVTITTLGYGDIVPVTCSARMLIASEAILGVILAGLFLNSLALRLVNRKAASDKHEPRQLASGLPSPEQANVKTDKQPSTQERS
jgi:hypothetical protein